MIYQITDVCKYGASTYTLYDEEKAYAYYQKRCEDPETLYAQMVINHEVVSQTFNSNIQTEAKNDVSQANDDLHLQAEKLFYTMTVEELGAMRLFRKSMLSGHPLVFPVLRDGGVMLNRMKILGIAGDGGHITKLGQAVLDIVNSK